MIKCKFKSSTVDKKNVQTYRNQGTGTQYSKIVQKL